MKHIIFFSLISLISCSVNAKDCLELVSSTDIRECYSEKLNSAEKKLLLTYQSKLNTLEPDNKQQLIKAQRLWVQFKEADCIQVANQFDDRTGAMSLRFECLMNKAIAREKELERR